MDMRNTTTKLERLSSGNIANMGQTGFIGPKSLFKPIALFTARHAQSAPGCGSAPSHVQRGGVAGGFPVSACSNSASFCFHAAARSARDVTDWFLVPLARPRSPQSVFEAMPAPLEGRCGQPTTHSRFPNRLVARLAAN